VSGPQLEEAYKDIDPLEDEVFALQKELASVREERDAARTECLSAIAILRELHAMPVECIGASLRFNLMNHLQRFGGRE